MLWRWKPLPFTQQRSTEQTPAVADDNLFRLAPNDNVEGAAIASLMHADDLDTLIPIDVPRGRTRLSAPPLPRHRRHLRAEVIAIEEGLPLFAVDL
jgi:hypothetical protein